MDPIHHFYKVNSYLDLGPLELSPSLSLFVQFEVSDLVLQKILPIAPDFCGNFTPTYDDLYVVKKVLTVGASDLGLLSIPR